MSPKHPLAQIFSFPILLALVLSSLLPVPIVSAATITVINLINTGPGSLRQAIIDANPGDSIVFDASLSGQTISLFSELVIDKDLTIDGSDLAESITITGGFNTRVLKINSGVSVTLNTLKIRHGSADFGGGILNHGNLTVINCIISNSHATFSGGGIHNMAGTLTVMNSIITDNHSMGNAGGISNDSGKLTVTNSTISNNRATVSCGGILNVDGILLVKKSIISNNRSSGSCGGICNAPGDLTVENSTISLNEAEQNEGGGICNIAGPTTVIASTITENTAKYAGGGIYSVQGNLSVIDSSLADNRITEIDGSGGGIHIEPGWDTYPLNVLLEGSTLRDNFAWHGGGLYIGEDENLTVSLTDCTLDGNHAEAQSGGIYNGSKLEITRTTVSNNTAKDHGGGIYNEGTLTMLNTTLRWNNTTEWNGGAIYNKSGSVEIDNSTFSKNIAGWYGGAIYNEDSLTVYRSTFSENEASYGGGIFNKGSLTMKASTVSDNASGGFGGGIFNHSGKLEVTNSTFSGNTVQGSGGAIFSRDQLRITHSTFFGNSAHSNGGGICISEGSLGFINTIVANSTSGGDCFIGSGVITTNIRNLVQDGSCAADLSGDPLLGPLADNGGPTYTHALLDGSPAIDAGDDAFCPATDQRGVPRPQGAGCDIGAFEFKDEAVTLYFPLFLK